MAARLPRAAAALLLAAALACTLSGQAALPPTEPPSPTERPATATAALIATKPSLPTASPAPTFPPPALDKLPLYWFGPLPPMPTRPGREYIGSEDFMDLFQPGARWTAAGGHLQVFKLYGEWVGSASGEELQQAVRGIGERGLAVAVEVGPLEPPGDCGEGVESFNGASAGLFLAGRIKAAGGAIHLIAMDEPYFYGHFYDGPNACHWEAEQIARGVDAFIQAMRAEFPEIIIGDTEPLAGPAGAPEYQAWLETFRAVAGYDLAFLHMDVDWGRPAWPAEVKAIEERGRALGAPVGIIYNGTSADLTDEAWLSAAGERAREYEQEAGGRPDHVLFQSWDDHPDFVLPDDQPYTFTNLIRTYFENPDALGFRREGPGANLALKKPATASNWGAGFEPVLAVDGNPATWWSADAGPPQWIEIDLGEAYNIQEIRLTPSQYPAGRTVHRVLGKGPGTSGAFTELHTFDSDTQDLQTLVFSPPQPWQGISTIRIETASSPSWVAWREIEVIDAGP